VWGKELDSSPGEMVSVVERVLTTRVEASNWGELKRAVNKSIAELRRVLSTNVKEYSARVAGMPKNSEVVIEL